MQYGWYSEGSYVNTEGKKMEQKDTKTSERMSKMKVKLFKTKKREGKSLLEVSKEAYTLIFDFLVLIVMR